MTHDAAACEAPAAVAPDRGPTIAHTFGIGLAATTLLAPRAFRSQAMALWFLATAAGRAITGQLVSATEDLAKSYVPFFGTIGGVTLGLAALFFLVAPWIQRRIVEGEEDAPAPVEL